MARNGRSAKQLRAVARLRGRPAPVVASSRSRSGGGGGQTEEEREIERLRGEIYPGSTTTTTAKTKTEVLTGSQKVEALKTAGFQVKNNLVFGVIKEKDTSPPVDESRPFLRISKSSGVRTPVDSGGYGVPISVNYPISVAGGKNPVPYEKPKIKFTAGQQSFYVPDNSRPSPQSERVTYIQRPFRENPLLKKNPLAGELPTVRPVGYGNLETFQARVNRIEEINKQAEERLKPGRERIGAFALGMSLSRKATGSSLFGGGATETEVYKNALGFGVELGPATIKAGMTISAFTEARFIPETRELRRQELKRAGKETLKIYDPRTAQGRGTLITGAYFGLLGAGAKTARIQGVKAEIESLKVSEVSEAGGSLSSGTRTIITDMPGYTKPRTFYETEGGILQGVTQSGRKFIGRYKQETAGYEGGKGEVYNVVQQVKTGEVKGSKVSPIVESIFSGRGISKQREVFTLGTEFTRYYGKNAPTPETSTVGFYGKFKPLDRFTTKQVSSRFGIQNDIINPQTITARSSRFQYEIFDIPKEGVKQQVFKVNDVGFFGKDLVRGELESPFNFGKSTRRAERQANIPPKKGSVEGFFKDKSAELRPGYSELSGEGLITRTQSIYQSGSKFSGRGQFERGISDFLRGETLKPTVTPLFGGVSKSRTTPDYSFKPASITRSVPESRILPIQDITPTTRTTPGTDLFTRITPTTRTTPGTDLFTRITPTTRTTPFFGGGDIGETAPPDRAPPGPPIGFFLPELGTLAKSRKSKIPYTGTSFKYTPSFSGIVLGVKRGKKAKQRKFTGFEIRGF